VTDSHPFGKRVLKKKRYRPPPGETAVPASPQVRLFPFLLPPPAGTYDVVPVLSLDVEEFCAFLSRFSPFPLLWVESSTQLEYQKDLIKFFTPGRIASFLFFRC